MNSAARSTNLESRLRDAMSAQAAGRLVEAEASYRAILRETPRLPDGLHLLAQCLHLQGRHDEALGFVDKAVACSPRVAMYRGTRGIVLRALARSEEAIATFREALRIDRGYLSAHRNLAAILAVVGENEAAREAFTRAIALAPQDVELWLGLGRVMMALGRPGEAAAAGERAAGLAPRSAPAIELWVSAAEAAAALPLLRDKLAGLLAGDTDNIAMHFALTDVLLKLEAVGEARALAERAVMRWPDNGAAWRRLGIQRSLAGEHAAAAEAFRRVLHLDPSDAVARVDIANCFHRLGESDRALSQYRDILEQHPRCKEAWYNVGTVLSTLGREAEAITEYTRALDLDPEYAAARSNRGQGLLRLGRFDAAWSDHRWRDGRTGAFPDEPWPRDLSGRTIHVKAEQGIGDHLFFLRFVPLIVARGATVSVEAERRIEPMVVRSGLHAVDFAPAGAEIRRMGDLPWLLGLGDGDSFVPPIALPILGDRVARVTGALSDLPRPWIGVTWHAGGAKGRRETFKTVPTARLGEALRELPGTVVSVQRNPVAAEQTALAAALGRPLVDLNAWNEDLESMLALMAALDGYVGVSNANVHLRCGAGLGSDVLVPFPMDWRWRALGDGTVPWYPGSRAYHERRPGGWDDAFASLAATLRARWS